MANRDDNQSSHEVLTLTSQAQSVLEPVKAEDPECDPITNSSSKRRKTPNGTVGLWRENKVGMAAKELLEAVEHHYPNTFQGVQIRGSTIWLTILTQFHVVMKSFMETSVDKLKKEQIDRFQEDLKEFQTFGLDVSWAHQRLDMVDRLKFGKEPLQKELMAVEESLEPLEAKVEWQWQQMMAAHDLWREAQSEYENAKNSRDNMAHEMEEKYGSDYDQVLKSQLGFGMLPRVQLTHFV